MRVYVYASARYCSEYCNVLLTMLEYGAEIRPLQTPHEKKCKVNEQTKERIFSVGSEGKELLDLTHAQISFCFIVNYTSVHIWKVSSPEKCVQTWAEGHVKTCQGTKKPICSRTPYNRCNQDHTCMYSLATGVLKNVPPPSEATNNINQ